MFSHPLCPGPQDWTRNGVHLNSWNDAIASQNVQKQAFYTFVFALSLHLQASIKALVTVPFQLQTSITAPVTQLKQGT
jgi:hypothetical protein